MNKLQNFLSVLLISSIYMTSFAYAPVVDESENFAVNSSEPENFKALAHDDTTSNSYFDDSRKSSNSSGAISGNRDEIARLLNQLQELQQTVQELKGQIDTQNHTIDNLKNQQLTLYKDLDDRLNLLNGKSGIAKPQPSIAEPIKPASDVSISEPPNNHAKNQNPADEQISYMAAYEFVQQKQYQKAQLALQEFVQQYPQSAYIPNAEYWLGELYLQNKNYASAIAHFENVVNNYPSSNKHAACLYKLGVTLAANGQTAEAKNKYQNVVQQYPDSDTAKLAQKQLNLL